MSGTSFAEEEFQAHLSFEETEAPDEPITGPYGGVGPVGALGGRLYRAIVLRNNPIAPPPPPPPRGPAGPPMAPGPPVGTYYIETDYDVAMADLDHEVNVASVGGTLRIGDLLRIGSLPTADGRVRGLYQLRLADVGVGTPSDLSGSLVTVTMKRCNPNLKNPAI